MRLHERSIVKAIDGASPQARLLVRSPSFSVWDGSIRDEAGLSAHKVRTDGEDQIEAECQKMSVLGKCTGKGKESRKEIKDKVPPTGDEYLYQRPPRPRRPFMFARARMVRIYRP